MKLIILIAITLFAYNLNANHIKKIIELHSSQSLDKLILEGSDVNNDNVNTTNSGEDISLKLKELEARVIMLE